MIRSCQPGQAFKMKSTPIKEQQVQRPKGRQEPGVLKGWCGWSTGLVFGGGRCACRGRQGPDLVEVVVGGDLTAHSNLDVVLIAMGSCWKVLNRELVWSDLSFRYTRNLGRLLNYQCEK